ncbi:MAG: FAD-dependent monooxygenase [Pseudomonas sp.]
MSTINILIAGAGTTGLMLALRLARAGVPFRIIERNRGPGQAPAAIVAQALAIEFYQQIVLAEQLIEHGINLPSPFELSFPHDDHDDCLLEQLSALGVEVEWGVALQQVEQHRDHVAVTLVKNGLREVCEVGYLCGCEGARGVLRNQHDLTFPSDSDNPLFYVADVVVDGPQRTNVYLRADRHQLTLMAPVRSGMQRLVGTVAPELLAQQNLTFEDERAGAEHRLATTLGKAHWMSTYRVHQHVAEVFRACLMLPGACTPLLKASA